MKVILLTTLQFLQLVKVCVKGRKVFFFFFNLFVELILHWVTGNQETQGTNQGAPWTESQQITGHNHSHDLTTDNLEIF